MSSEVKPDMPMAASSSTDVSIHLPEGALPGKRRFFDVLLSAFLSLCNTMNL